MCERESVCVCVSERERVCVCKKKKGRGEKLGKKNLNPFYLYILYYTLNLET